MRKTFKVLQKFCFDTFQQNFCTKNTESFRKSVKNKENFLKKHMKVSRNTEFQKTFMFLRTFCFCYVFWSYF